MASNSSCINTTPTRMHGRMYCRPADWTDVAKFFLANYFAHAFTVITTPGEKRRESISFVLWALVTPFAGVGRAVGVIARFARGAQSDLEEAQRAGALYTLVKFKFIEGEGSSEGKWTCEPPGVLGPGYRIDIASMIRRFDCFLQYVHGVIPAFPKQTSRSFYMPVEVRRCLLIRPIRPVANRHSEPTDGAPPSSGVGTVVSDKADPPVTILERLADPDTSWTALRLSSSSSAVKSAAAIFQVLYGSWELYLAQGSQLTRYGYAAYSLTLVPYVAMSLLNLVATLCQQQYPCVYLVKYGDTVGGDVGRELNSVMEGAVGTIDNIPEIAEYRHRWKAFRASLSEELHYDTTVAPGAPRPLSAWRKVPRFILAGIIGCCAYLATYVVAFVLTGFEGRESTLLQRRWFIAWLFYGQAVGLTAFVGMKPIVLSLRPQLAVVYTIVWSLYLVPGIGMFVIVARMMLAGEVCKIV